MWKFSLCVSLVSFLMVSVLADYSITPSQEEGSYHYPAPPKSQQLFDPFANNQPSNYASHPQAYQNQYQVSYNTAPLVQQSSVLTRQFASPALDNAAFNLALTDQGYTFGNTQAVNAALTLNLRSSKTTSQKAPSSTSTSSSSSTPVIGSLNVKLPLPIGVTPLNIAPLPLQSGTPYANIPNGVTSYGTLYPQRKRR